MIHYSYELPKGPLHRPLANGETLVVHPGVSSYNGEPTFRATYRGEALTYQDLDSVVRAADLLAEEAQRKTARAEALKEGKQARPALLITGSGLESGLEPITVRGVNQHSGHLLITREDGRKDKAFREGVLRPLTDVEFAELTGAQLAENRTQRAVNDARTAGRYLRDAVTELPKQTIVIRFDTDRSQYVATVSGTEVWGDTPGKVRRAVEYRLAAQKYPWGTSGDEVVSAVAETSGAELFFATEGEAQNYVDAVRALTPARVRVRELTQSYQFVDVPTA